MNATEVQSSGFKRFVVVILSAFLVLAACSGSDENGQDSEEGTTPDTVTFNMGWLPQGSMSGFIVAIDQGFYEEMGLEVEAVRGFGGIRTVNEIDQGMFDFGYGDPLAVILNRGRGGKTKMIGAINNRWPAALCFVVSRHQINSPADLAGLTIGGGQTSPMQVIVPEWLELNGVERNSVNLMQLDPSIVANSLIQGQIDAGECWMGNSLAIFQNRAASAGLEIDSIEYSAFGLDIYGNGIVASEKMMAEKPVMIEKFLAATYRGYAWVEQNRAAATDIIVARYPVLDEAITRQQIDEMVDLMSGDGASGWMDAQKISQTLAFLSLAYDVESSIGVDDIYTTQFLQSNTAGEQR